MELKNIYITASTSAEPESWKQKRDQQLKKRPTAAKASYSHSAHFRGLEEGMEMPSPLHTEAASSPDTRFEEADREKKHQPAAPSRLRELQDEARQSATSSSQYSFLSPESTRSSPPTLIGHIAPPAMNAIEEGSVDEDYEDEEKQRVCSAVL